MQVLGEKVELEVAADPAAAACLAHAVQQGFLGRVERADHPAVLLRELDATLLDVELAHRFEQRSLQPDVAP